MPYQFRNLVFDGGGVKGGAYIGAMEVIEEKGILENILRVGGTSTGAISATLVVLGFTSNEQRVILRKLDFNRFLDRNLGISRNLNRLVSQFGWHKGDFFRDWIGLYIKEKLGKAEATFEDLEKAKKPKLYVYGTNLNTHFGELCSIEHSPTMPIIDALRIAMSIPLLFQPVRNSYNDVLVDGGLLYNYPIKLFDREKYITPENQSEMALKRPYYEAKNSPYLRNHPESSPLVYNKETLGLRLDSKLENATFLEGGNQSRKKIDNLGDYVIALISIIMESQSNTHLHSDDWSRTIYIDTLGVSTFDLDLSETKKMQLEESGRKGAENYFDWFDNWAAKRMMKPIQAREAAKKAVRPIQAEEKVPFNLPKSWYK